MRYHRPVTARSAEESAIHAACAAGDRDRAVTLALQAYGQELIEYLVAMARDPAVGSDAFSLCAEQIWRNLEKFRWEASVRTWCYVLARRALSSVQRAGAARRARQVALSDAPEVAAVAEKVRTRTITFLRTDVKDAFARLRDSLSSEERELLVLRIDRKLPWRDVARILTEGEDLDDTALARRTATLRKRFEVLKGRLRELADSVREA